MELKKYTKRPVVASWILIDGFETFLWNLKLLKIIDFLVRRLAFLEKLMGSAEPIEHILTPPLKTVLKKKSGRELTG